jgi:hypothetical protein
MDAGHRHSVSLLGVLVIVLRGNLAALSDIQVNSGDISFAGALFVFRLYSALMSKRPKINPLSLIAFTTGAGAVMLLPLVGWEVSAGNLLILDTLTIATVVFVVISLDAGLHLLQSRHRTDRPQPHGAVLPSGAGVRLGDGDPAARREAGAVSSRRLCAGAGRHFHPHRGVDRPGNVRPPRRADSASAGFDTRW